MTVIDSDTKDYFRPDPKVSRHRRAQLPSRPTACFALAILLAAQSAAAQYPGRVTKSDKPAPTLRSVAVLEWVGEPGKPTASRLVPISVYDGEQLNEGSIYLNRPEPLALAGGTEYELQSGGKSVHLFDVFSSGEFHGSWLGFGAVKALPSSEAEKAANAFNTSSLMNGGNPADDDKPVLKRKHPKGSDTGDAGSSGSDAGKGSPSSPSNPSGAGSSDSPTLKRKPDDSSGSGASGGTSDPDRPTLKRKSSDDSSSQTASSGKGSAEADPDRPTLRRARRSNDAGALETSNLPPDPDRPRLKHGKPAELDRTESPRLDGMPANMQQAVAVSDAANRVEHPWKYVWANPDDELKMKEALEAIARTALGMDTPPAPAKTGSRSATKTTAAKAPVHKKTSMLHPDAPAELPALADEQFRVFELTYGATATLVLTAASPKPVADESGSAETVSAETTSGPSNAPVPDETPVIKRGKPVQTTSSTTGEAASQTPSQTPGKSTAKSASKLKAAVPTAKPAPQKFVTLIAQPDLYGGILVLYKSVTDSAHLDETPRMRLIDAVDALGDNRGELLFELRGAGQRQFALYRILRGSAEQLFATASQQ